MTRIYVLLLLFFVFGASNSLAQQSDTIYLDNLSERLTVQRKVAEYLQITSTNENGITSVQILTIKNNQLVEDQYYLDGAPIGQWNWYNDDGSVWLSIPYYGIIKEGEIYLDLTKEKLNNQTDTGNIQYPSFMKGAHDLFNFVGKRVSYPPFARENGIQGMVVAHLKISETGKVIPLGIYEGVHPLLDQEVVKVLKIMPHWNPAKIDGNYAVSYVLMPVRFSLR